MLKALKQDLANNGFISFSIRVHTRAKTNRVKSVLADGKIKIDITSPPEDGRANERIIELFSNEFKVSRQQVKIITGQSSSDKIISITI